MSGPASDSASAETTGASSAAVTVGPAAAAGAAATIDRLETDQVATRIKDHDATLWGPDAEKVAAERLGWVDLPSSSRELLPRLDSLRKKLQSAGVTHIVLAGMGGSSLAPEVITQAEGVPLTVLDTTDPHQVRRTLDDRIRETAVVVASKSGGTVETDSHRRAYEAAFRDAGLRTEEIAVRIVVVTDPGSPLEQTARDAGYEVILADPAVGGRYSALSAFGLVPSALAGADVAALLDDAAAVTEGLADRGPATLLGGTLGAGAADEGRDKIVIASHQTPAQGFGDWAEQLVAESTGKSGRGLLPVVVEGVDAPGFSDAGSDARRVVVGAAPDGFDEVAVAGPLGAQFLLWEYATAIAARVIDVEPFDQPNVAESKENTQRLLDEGLPLESPAFVDGAVEVYGSADLAGPDQAADLSTALRQLVGTLPDNGYLAVMAYLDRVAEADVAALRPALATAAGGRAVTFGWGPRFLHSTGQYHKGGPQVGSFLQITGAVTQDVDVPGRPFTFGTLQAAQAAGDLAALGSRGRPTLRLHLTDRAQGVAQLVAAARSLAGDGA